MKRISLVIAVGYLLIAAGNRVAEHFGVIRCGCAEDCWCHRPRFSLFRWVFPWGHRAAQSEVEKSDLDLP